MAVASSDEIFAWLRGQAEREIETSCARVFLAGGRALKVKKPVDFGFLDFTTLEKRRWALERELRFNRGAAPDIYRRVLAITRGPGAGRRRRAGRVRAGDATVRSGRGAR
jgi:aminoglycoside phosphotransferase family enzyme